MRWPNPIKLSISLRPEGPVQVYLKFTFKFTLIDSEHDVIGVQQPLLVVRGLESVTKVFHGFPTHVLLSFHQ